jgi:hypothetical protein
MRRTVSHVRLRFESVPTVVNIGSSNTWLGHRLQLACQEIPGPFEGVKLSADRQRCEKPGSCAQLLHTTEHLLRGPKHGSRSDRSWLGPLAESQPLHCFARPVVCTSGKFLYTSILLECSVVNFLCPVPEYARALAL